MKYILIIAFLFTGVVNYAQEDLSSKISSTVKEEKFDDVAKIKAAFKSKGEATFGRAAIMSVFMGERPADVTNNNSPNGSFMVGTMESDPQGNQGAVVFGFDKATLDHTSKLVLQRFAKLVLDTAPNISITVSGHTDSSGSKKYNYGLSERRALAVKRYLTKQGLTPSQIKVIGFGEERPIKSNATKIGRAMNRRVEFDFY